MCTYATILCLLWTVSAFAVQPYTPVHPDPVLEPWRWRSFPELKGLGLRCLAEDKDGNMWFGVNDGVRVYDGVNWTAYTPQNGLLGAPVNVLLATGDGSVYAGTAWGVSRFKGGTWSRVFPLEGDLFWGIADLMEAADGSVWAGTVWGALQLAKESATLFTTETVATALRRLAPNVQVSAVPDDAFPAVHSWSRPFRGATGQELLGEGIGAMVVGRWIWALAPEGPAETAGLKVRDILTAIDGEPLSPSVSRWSTLRQLFGPAGTSVGLTVQREGLARPFEVTVTRKQVEGMIRDFAVYDIYEDREGTLWLGLDQGEILRCNIHRAKSGDPSAWRLYTEREGLDIGFLPHIAQTPDGIVWTVSREPGKRVNRFDGKAWRHVSLEGSQSPSGILATKEGSLWVGGRTVYRNGAWRRYQDLPLPPVRIADMLEASDGALWFAGSGQEAVRLDSGTSRWASYEGLNFQCETANGARWFVSGDSSVVGNHSQIWTRYGVEDGLMDYPVSLIATRQGRLWAAGTHRGNIAVARFDGQRWSRQTHIQIPGDAHYVIVYEAWDGALWMSFRSMRAVFRFDPSAASEDAWTRFNPPDVPPLVYGFGQTADGVLWAGGSDLRRFDGQSWTAVTEPEELARPYINTIFSTPEGNLWVGTRAYGLFHFDGRTWTRYDTLDGLADNQVRGILEADDGSVWIATFKGISRTDGQVWVTDALSLPEDLPVVWRGLSLRQSRDGAVWINLTSQFAMAFPLRTLRYSPDTDPPETRITASLDQVSQPGNTVLSWEGADPWKVTPESELRYAWRLDGREWAPFSTEKHKVFFALPSEEYTFEVKARDRDFNEDSTPATASFTVVPPVWQQGWFIGMVVVFLGGIGFQTSRVVRRDRRLREGNQALSDANKELFQVNVDLQREQVLERLRGQAQGMQSSEDIKPVVEAVYRELSGFGLRLIDSSISIDISDTEWEIWVMDESGRVSEKFVKRGASRGEAQRAIRERGEYFRHVHLEGEDAKERVRSAIAEGNPRWVGVPEDRWPDPWHLYWVFIKGGRIFVSFEETIAEDYLALIKRFGEVFGYAHSRYKELQEKEAQNQE